MIDEKALRKHIAKKVKDYRLDNKWSQKKLGELVGVSHNTISDYENAKIAIGQDMLFNLAEVFGVTIDDLFPARKESINIEDFISNEDFDITDIEFLRQLIEKAKSLTTEERAKFMQNIRLAVEFFEKTDK